MTEPTRYPGADNDGPPPNTARARTAWRYAAAILGAVALLVVLHLTGVVGG